jgi:hypothetical protein
MPVNPDIVDHAEEYERDNVHQVYEQIATHFSSTRYKVHAVRFRRQ